MLTAHLTHRPIKGHGQVGLPLILGGAAAHMGASYAGTRVAPPPEPRGVPALPSELMPDRWWEVAN